MIEPVTKRLIHLPRDFNQSFFIHPIQQRKFRLGTRIYLERPTALFHIMFNPDLPGNRPAVHTGNNLARQFIRTIRYQVYIQPEITLCPIAFPDHFTQADDLFLNFESGQRIDLANSITTVFHHKGSVFHIMDKRAIEVHTHRDRIDLPLFKIHKILP